MTGQKQRYHARDGCSGCNGSRSGPLLEISKLEVLDPLWSSKATGQYPSRPTTVSHSGGRFPGTLPGQEYSNSGLHGWMSLRQAFYVPSAKLLVKGIMRGNSDSVCVQC